MTTATMVTIAVDLVLLHPARLHLIWGVLALVVLLAWLEARGRDALSRFISATMQARLAVTASRGRRAARLACIAAASAAAIIALARPQSRTGTEVVAAREAAAEVMVVLDVSKSMLAEDAAPNRLERAKAELRDLARELAGHKLGLVAFAGRASVLCPLTPDPGFFRLTLDAAGTRSVTRGGTRVGDGIRKALACFSEGLGARAIILVTDGEDHESYPEEAAKQAVERGVRIVAIGFGDEKGSEVPVTDPRTGERAPLRDRDGNVVRSRLDGETLRRVALATEGVYVPAGVGVLDLESIVRRHLDPLLRQAATPGTRVVRAERYPPFVLLSFTLFIAAAVLGGRIARPRAAFALVLVLAVALPTMARADDAPRAAYNAACAALERGDLDAAAKGFLDARDRAGADPELRFRAAFNLGMAHAARADGVAAEKMDEKMAALREAAAWFRDAVRLNPEDADARVNLEVVLRRIQALADEVNQKEGLEAKLDRLIEEERSLRDEVRGLAARVAAADAKTEPVAFLEPFRGGAGRQQSILAEAGTIAALASEEKGHQDGKPDAERTDADRLRAAQLHFLGAYLERARDRMADARRLLRRLQGEAAHRKVDAALRELVRAREQLRHPVEVLRAVAGDEAQLREWTAALAEAGKLDLSAGPLPAWLTAAYLGERQQDARERAAELLARLEAVVASRAEPESEPSQDEDPKVKRMMEAARESVPYLEDATAAMEAVEKSLGEGKAREAVELEDRALAALVRALERFAGLRDLIELACAEQRGILDLLTPPAEDSKAAPPLSTEERAKRLKTGVVANAERMARLESLIAEAVKALEATPPEGAPANKNAPGIERHRLAETERKAAADALAKLASGLEAEGSAGGDLLAPAKDAAERIEALRRLFFSIIEHIRDLAGKQARTRDDTATLAAEDDVAKRTAGAPPLAALQAGHGAFADQIATALDEGAKDSREPGAAKPLADAASEVKAAARAMEAARGALAPEGGADPEAKPALEHQAEALEHLARAILILDPQSAEQDPGESGESGKQGEVGEARKEEERGAASDRAARMLQQVRDREAERFRDRERRAHPAPEPVEKDW